MERTASITPTSALMPSTSIQSSAGSSNPSSREASPRTIPAFLLRKPSVSLWDLSSTVEIMVIREMLSTLERSLIAISSNTKDQTIEPAIDQQSIEQEHPQEVVHVA